VTSILAALDVTTSRPLASLPRVDCIVRERATSPAYRIDARGRPRVQLAVQIGLGGRGEVQAANGRRQELLPGSALVFVTGMPVRYGFPGGGGEPWDFVYANLDGSAAIAVGRDLVARRGHRIELGRHHPLISALLDRLPSTGRRHLRWSAGESARVAWDLVQALVDAAEREDEDPALLDRAMALLIADPARPSDVGSVAAALGLSREYLSRRFAQELGRSPAAWQREQRLRHAAGLLRGERPVAEVAQRCGFATASHFIQAFKRLYAQTPARYARGGGSA
jgi:AraC-like DNA-binding protein